MDDQTKKVFAGWLRLTEEERRQLEQEIAAFSRKTSWEQAALRESMAKAQKVATGPIDSVCPCCGR